MSMAEPYLLETHRMLVDRREYIGIIAPEGLEIRKELETIVGNENIHLDYEEGVIYCKTHKPDIRVKLANFADQYQDKGVKKIEGNYYALLGWDWFDKLVKEL